MHNPQKAYSLKYILVYGLRVCGAMLLLEVALHYFYVVAVSKYTTVWAEYSCVYCRFLVHFAQRFVLMRWDRPAEIGSVGYFVLMFLWLKFFIMWRFSRFWALLDGIESPENMTRCMNNNYTLTGFWRYVSFFFMYCVGSSILNLSEVLYGSPFLYQSHC